MADKAIPLRKEFVTIGFSIMDKIPAEYKEMFRSLLVAIDDNELHPANKLYDDITEKVTLDNPPGIMVMKSFLLLFHSCSITPDKNTGKKPEMTDDGDVFTIDPNAIEKSKKPGKNCNAPEGWITW